MTLETTHTKIEFVATAGQVNFTVNYKFNADENLRVYVDDVLQTQGTDYTVAGEGDDEGGTVTFNTAPGDGKSVKIFRWVEPQQNVDLVNNDPFDAETVEQSGLDKLMMICQQLLQRTGGDDFSLGTDDVRYLPLGDAGHWDAQSLKITNVATPTAGTDAANKAYVDAVAATGGDGVTGTFLRTLDGVGGDDDDNVDLVAGANVTITPNPGGNSITIAAGDLSGGNATAIGGIDVCDTAPTDGQVLVYDDAESEICWQTFAAGALKALLTFDGTGATGTKSPKMGFNLTVVKNSTATYRCTFDTNMPNADYVVVGAALAAASGSARLIKPPYVTEMDTTGFTITLRNESSSPSLRDSPHVMLLVFAV